MAFLAGFTLLVVLAAASAQSPTVSYDARALLINGTRKLILSGAIHYVRSSRYEWDRLFKLASAMGLNNIQTYVFWNFHEPQFRRYMFDDRGDLERFLQTAQANNLTVTLRIGPYACAEYQYGGFPIWLRDIPGIEFRTYNEPFMREMQTWMTYLVNRVRPYFFSNGGPIIMAQVENEYSYEPNEKQGERYANWAIDMAESLKTGVPWNMCHGVCAGSALCTINGFWQDTFDKNPNQPSPGWMSDQKKEHPKQPLMWTEDQGWFDEWGIAQRVRNSADIAYGIARWFAYGGTYHNFYMFHGGNNFGRSVEYDQTPWGATGLAGRDVVTAYAPDVMVDSWGHVHNPRYAFLRKLFGVLKRYESDLLENDAPVAKKLAPGVEVHEYGKSFAFVSNYNGSETVAVKYRDSSLKIPPQTVILVDEYGFGEFNTSDVNDDDYESPKPVEMKTEPWVWYGETVGNGTYTKENETPVEMLLLTRGQTELCWYNTEVDVEAAVANATLDLGSTPGDQVVYVFIDGKLTVSGWASRSLDVGSLDAGSHVLNILVSSLGLANGGRGMETFKKGLATDSIKLAGTEIVSNGWNMTWMLTGEAQQIFTYLGNTVDWKNLTQAAIGRPVTWLKTAVNISKSNRRAGDSDNTSYALDLSGATKGFAWVNGYALGRYWLLPGECKEPCGRSPYMRYREGSCGKPTQHLYHIGSEWMDTYGFNTVILLEEEGIVDINAIKVVELTSHPILD